MRRNEIYDSKSILITVKTYPTMSAKYDELVCTAGIDEHGDWFRIYPMPFRSLDYERQYKKYAWLELSLERNRNDPRPESYRPTNLGAARIKEEMVSDRGAWITRRKFVLKHVYYNLESLILEAKKKSIQTSLATFKPKRILDFVAEPVDREWDPKKVTEIEERRKQLSLFEDENPLRVVRKLPYKFSYRFEDDTGREAKLMIEDWETGQLFWNCLARTGSEASACDDVRRKYFDDFARTKDLYLFLGTTKAFHWKSPNPFIIVGTFHPAYQVQSELF